MDIKLIRNFQGGNVKAAGSGMLLVVKEKAEGLEYVLVDADSIVKQVIMPDIRKYKLYEFVDVTGLKDYVYFTGASDTEDGLCRVDIYRYSIAASAGTVIHSAVYEKSAFDSLLVKVIVADEEYLIIQEQQMMVSVGDTSWKRFNYIYLYSIADGQQHTIHDSLIAELGIEHIVQLSGNICALKLGISNIEYKLYGNELWDFGRELIVLVNIRQLISDLVLEKENVTMEVLDEGSDLVTFPHIRLSDGRLLYSRANLSDGREEIIVYDNTTKTTRVRLNNRISYVSEFGKTYLIQDVLYFLQEDEKSTKFVNLDTQKSEWRIGSDKKVLYICKDFVVLQQHRKAFLGFKECNFTYVYHYPDTKNYLLRDKALCVCCLITEEDELFLFCK